MIPIKGLQFEDFVNYKKPSMFIIFAHCNFKCDKENGIDCCQNSNLVMIPTIYVSANDIVKNYLNNPITNSIVIGGLEPFYDWEALKELIQAFRQETKDDIVIYTGYKENELIEQIQWLKFYSNIIVKFGRYIPNQKKHYDDVLGVYLASDNQYGEVIS